MAVSAVAAWSGNRGIFVPTLLGGRGRSQSPELWDDPPGQVLVRIPLPPGVLCGLATTCSFPTAVIWAPLLLKQVLLTSLPSQGCLGEKRGIAWIMGVGVHEAKTKETLWLVYTTDFPLGTPDSTNYLH